MALFAQLFESRTHPQNPSDWLLYALTGGIGTSAGVKVNEETAMRLSAVFACVKILAESTSSLPLKLYQREGKGKRLAVEHRLYKLMHDQPNPEMTSMVFRETSMAQLALWGNSYAYKTFDVGKRLVGLWPMASKNMAVERKNKQLVYTYQDNNNQMIFGRDEVLHIPGLSYNGINGLSPIAQAREAIGMAFAAEGFGSKFFDNGLRPSGILTHPNILAEKGRKNLKASIKDAIGGLDNAHKLLLLEEGMKWEQMGVPPEDAQFLETRNYQIAEIARVYRIPLHMLNELSHSTYSNVEHMSLDFVVHTLTSWLVRHEQAYNMQLLSESDRKAGYFFEHLVSGLLRGDMKSRYDAYAVGRNNGWLSANDIRELENMNPIDDGGDIYLVPLNMVNAANPMVTNPVKEEKALSIIEKRDAKDSKIAESTKRLRGSYYGIFKEVAQRIVNKEVKAIQRAVKNHLGQRSVKNFESWVDEFYFDMDSYIVRIMKPAFQAYANMYGPEALSMIGSTASTGAQFEQFLDAYVDVFAKRHIGSSKGQLKALMEKYTSGGLVDELTQRTNEWFEKRADKVALNETSRAINAGRMYAWMEAGVKKLRWIAVGKSCPYCESLNGKIVGINKPFVDSNMKINQDGSWMTLQIFKPKLHPPLHAGCDCMILPEI